MKRLIVFLLIFTSHITFTMERKSKEQHGLFWRICYYMTNYKQNQSKNNYSEELLSENLEKLKLNDEQHNEVPNGSILDRWKTDEEHFGSIIISSSTNK